MIGNDCIQKKKMIGNDSTLLKKGKGKKKRDFF